MILSEKKGQKQLTDCCLYNKEHVYLRTQPTNLHQKEASNEELYDNWINRSDD